MWKLEELTRIAMCRMLSGSQAVGNTFGPKGHRSLAIKGRTGLSSGRQRSGLTLTMIRSDCLPFSEDQFSLNRTSGAARPASRHFRGGNPAVPSAEPVENLGGNGDPNVAVVLKTTNKRLKSTAIQMTEPLW